MKPAVGRPVEFSIPGPDSKKRPGSGRIAELDGLRGTAILLVILCHYVADAPHKPLGFVGDHLYTILDLGWSGVDLFFVLSGFLIGGILLEVRNSKNYFRTFYLRRAHRILPVYYCLIVLYIGTVVLCASPLMRPVVMIPPGQTLSLKDIGVVPKYFLFLQNIFYSPRAFEWVWFIVTWSLAVEEQFYLLAPPVIRFLSQRYLILVLSLTILLAPFLRYIAFVHLSRFDHLAQFAMPCRADALALGILGSVAWRTPAVRDYLKQHPAILTRSTVYLGVCLVGLLWWLVRPLNLVMLTVGYSCLGLFYTSLLLLVLSQSSSIPAQVMRSTILRRIGTISYCVYLFHDLVNQLAHRFLMKQEPSLATREGIAITCLSLGLTLLIAGLSWRYFERPLIRRGHQFSYE